MLLGAGASVDARLPAATLLAKELYSDFRMRGLPEAEVLAVRAVIGGLHFRRSTVGTDPFGGVDVEDIYSALLTLESRQFHPLAPFVSAWHPALLKAEGYASGSHSVDRTGIGVGLTWASPASDPAS